MHDEVEDTGPLADVHIRTFCDAGQESSRNFGARLVALRVHDAMTRMGCLAAQLEGAVRGQIETCTSRLELEHARRTFFHQHLHRCRVTQGGTGRQGVTSMKRGGIACTQGSGYATLCVSCSGVKEGPFGEQHHRAVRRSSPCGVQAGYTAADHEEPGANSFGHIDFNNIAAPSVCQPFPPAGDRFDMRSLRVSRRAGARLLPVSAAAALTLTLSSTAYAQPGGVGPACEIETNSPKELFLANVQFQKAAGSEGADRQAALRKTMQELTNRPERFRDKNASGYHMVMAQTLALWLADESTSVQTTTSAIGMGAPDAPINLVDAIDAAYKGLVAAAPNCAGEVDAMRPNEGWLAMTRKALDFSQTSPDSAEIYANYSLRLQPETNPYPYQVLGIVSQRRGDLETAVQNWEKAVAASGTDTSYNDIRQNSLFYVGLYTLAQARELEGDAQKAKLNAAVGAMNKYMEDFGSSPESPTVMQGLGEAYLTLGDSTKVAGVYAPMIASPSAFSDYALTMSGVLATQVNKTADAVTLFEAAVAQNPYQRDALRNLAASYYTMNDFDKMNEPLDRLVALDPNNYDAWSMYAFGAQGRMQAAKVPAEKKKWTDSLIAYAAKADSLPVKVTVNEFERRDESVTFSASLEGNSVAPKAQTFTVEFLDKSGTVVTTSTEEVGAIPMGESKQVRFQAQGTGIVAYRYKPLT